MWAFLLLKRIKMKTKEEALKYIKECNSIIQISEKVITDKKKEILKLEKKFKLNSFSNKTKVLETFMKNYYPSKELAVIVGSKPLPRTKIVTKFWEYIKKNDLQNPKNKRNIIADQNLKRIFKKKEVSMFELAHLVGKHLLETKPTKEK